MKPSDVATALASLLPTRRAVYLWGPPGVGKSSVIKQAAASLDLEVIDLRAVLLDPVDLRGLPVINKGDDGASLVNWAPPSFLPLKGQGRKPGIIFADELAQAAPLVQAAFLQGILDHRIGEAEIDPEWTWVAASNRQEDRAGTHRLISPLLNRFIHLDMDVDPEDWHAWAVPAGVAPEVRSFLNFRPALLHSFDPAAGARSFPTPRSWQFVSDVLPTCPKNLEHPVFAGCVGEGPAAEFVGFLRIYQGLPDIDQVLANPRSGAVPKQPEVLFALAGAIAEKARKADARLLGNIVTYAGRMPDEFSVLTVRDSAAANRNILKTPECQQWLQAHRNLMWSAA